MQKKALILCFCLMCLGSAFGQSTQDKANALLSGMECKIFFSNLVDSEKSFLKDIFFATRFSEVATTLNTIIDNVYTEDVYRKSVVDALVSDFNDHYYIEFSSWIASDLCKKSVTLEEKYLSSAINDKFLVWESLSVRRRQLIKDFCLPEMVDAVITQMMIREQHAETIKVAITDGVYKDEELPKNNPKAMTEERRNNVIQELNLENMVMYHGLTDDELKQYINFEKTDAFKWYGKNLVKGIENADELVRKRLAKELRAVNIHEMFTKNLANNPTANGNFTIIRKGN